MEELIQRIVAATGIDEGTARQAIGMILGFLKKHAPEGPVGDLLNAIPGGEEAVEALPRRLRGNGQAPLTHAAIRTPAPGRAR